MKSIIYVDSRVYTLSGKNGCAVFLGWEPRLERVHVGSYSLYGDCFRHCVGCCSLYVGFTAAM